MVFKIKKIIYFLLLLSFFVSNLGFALAQNSDYGLTEAAQKAGIASENPGKAETSLAVIIGKIISTILSFLGVIFFILMVYGGFMWMTARGNETQVDKGRKIIMDAIWGLIVILMAYAVTALITGEFINAVKKSAT